MTYDADHLSLRRKKIKLRAWRRGLKEVDLLLGHYADVSIADMNKEDLDLFEAVLNETDQDIWAWITKQTSTPDRYTAFFADAVAALNEKTQNS